MAKGSHHGTFFWHEVVTPDPKGARKFYTDLIGWKTHDMDMGGMPYTVIQNGGTDIGGIFPMQGDQWKGIPPHWMIYIGVDDVDAVCKKATKLGGKVHQKPMDIPVGRFAVLEDPAGAVFAVFKPQG